jgi:hypothetical protein
MDEFIKNIHPTLYQQLLVELLESNIENNKKLIERFLRSKLKLTTKLTKHAKGYWIARGWADTEAYIKSKENKQKNCKSAYCQKTWLARINPTTGICYTVTEADFERNSRRPIKKEYWLKKGYEEIDAIKLAFETKDKNNKAGAKNANNTAVRRITSKRCLEYYTTRGYSAEEAASMLSDSQKHFSKDVCIQKYGQVEGLAIWKNRQDKWQTTLNSKSDEEKSRINRLKLSKGITVSSAEKIILAEIKKVIPSAEHQFTLINSNKKQYVYDIFANKKIIEYNGDFWHCNPIKYSADYINPRTKLKAVDKWEVDHVKLQYAKDQGYEVLVVWENDFKKNKEEVIKQCIQFLTQ